MTRDQEPETVTDAPDEDETIPVSLRVVRCVAAATDTDPTELPPLHRTIDTDSLDRVYDTGWAADPQVSFEFAGAQVVVAPDETVTVEPSATDD